ncbi:nuclear pore complex protein Nup153 isoform X2 [Hyperolius riggenbachi]|uniref:nuclear pore complex protein Nup153 isoform X2 n=1 Tax=Hyperolius riggenbachi TaxID=752182 RepID=UPI0035A380D7
MAAAGGGGGGGGGLGRGGKIRSRRYHLSAGRAPYTRHRQQNQGIISRVTDTVKSIVPGWLQRYFNTVEEAPGVPQRTNEEEVRVAFTHDDETDQFVDEPDGRVTPDPLRVQSDASTSHLTLNVPEVLTRPSLHRANLNFNILDSPALNCQPSTSTFPIGSSGISLVKEIKDSTSLHDDDNISTTSGFSSRASDKDVSVTRPGNVPIVWSPEADRSHNVSLNSSKKPAFNPSAFASLLPSLDRSTNRIGDSPFYPGKTTYGGAAAASSSRVRSTPYQAPVRRQVKAKPAHTNSYGVTSLAARRILQSLEKMSSPLADAKRIPSASSPASPLTSERSLINMGESASKRKKLDSSYPPVQKLVTPQSISVSSGLMRKVRPSLASSMLSSASNCRTPSADKHKMTRGNHIAEDPPPQPQSFSYPNFSTPASNGFTSGRGGGKMMTERVRDRVSTKTSDEEVQVPLLPDIPLPISTAALPKFNLNPEPKTSSPSVSQPVCIKTSVEKSQETPAPTLFKQASNAIQFTKSADASSFKFSQPLMKSTNFSNQTTASSVDFTFSAPALKTSLASTSTVSSHVKSPVIMNSSTKNAEEEDTGFFKPAKTLKEGSVMDILRNPGFISTSSEQTKPTAKSTVASPKTLVPDENRRRSLGIWYCKICLIENKASDSKCAACCTAKDQASEVTKQSTALSTPMATKHTSPLKSIGFGDKFKVAPGTWDCDTCLVQNKPESSKCVACESPKPGISAKATLLLLPTTKSDKPAVPPANSLTTSPSLKFEQLARKPAGSWECTICLVQNKAEDNKCVACTAPKPGASSIAATSLLAPVPPNQGSLTLLDQFKKPAGSWDCDVCLVQNKVGDEKCVACQTTKPGSKAALPAAPSLLASAPANQGSLNLLDQFKKPAGSWECEVCLVQNKAGDDKCVACQTAKPGTKAEVPGLATSFSFSAESKFPPVKFGLPSADTGESKSSTESSSSKSVAFSFKFGQNSNSDKDKEVKFGTAIKFGQSSNLDKDKEVKFGTAIGTSNTISAPFKFGFSSPSVTEKDSTVKTLTSNFQIGSPASKSESSGSASLLGQAVKEKSNMTPLFGSSEPEKKKLETPVVGGFTLGTVEQKETTTPFTFGKKDEKTDSATTTATTLFGSKSEEQPKTFVFGKPEPAKADSSAAPSFTFGQTNPTEKKETDQTAKPVFGFGLSAPDSSKPVFGFQNSGSSSTPQPSSIGSSVFGSGPQTTSSNVFGNTVQSNTAASAGAPTPSSTVFSSSSSLTAPTGSSNVFGNSLPSNTPAGSSNIFGSAPASGTPMSSSIAFGSAVPTSTAASTTSLFGNSSVSTNASSSPFVFGQPTTTAGSSMFGSGNESKPTFFSNQESKAATTSASTTPAAAASPFIFGSNASAPAAPSFNFGGTNTSNSTGTNSTPFIFGASQSAPAVSGVATASPVPAFGKSTVQNPTFGASASGPLFPSSSQPVPSFGSLSSNVQPPPFGQQSTQPTFGSNTAPSGGPSFQFGNSNFNFAANTTGGGVFTFGSNPSANPPPQPSNSGFVFQQVPTFNLGTNGKPSTPSSISNRKIKTARRRK